jgi:hypothetical protein
LSTSSLSVWLGVAGILLTPQNDCRWSLNKALVGRSKMPPPPAARF